MEELVKIEKFRTGAIHKYTGEYLNYEAVTTKPDGTLYTDVDINGFTIQKNKEGEYLRLSSSTIVTPYHFGCVENTGNDISSIDSTVRLQRFFDFVEVNSVYKIDCTCRLTVRDTIYIRGSGKLVSGSLSLLVPDGTFINGPVVKFENFQGSEFGNLTINAGTYSVRRAKTGISASGLRLAKIGNISVTGVRFYGMSISSVNNNMVVFNNLSFVWCGSDQGIVKNYEEISRNYQANSTSQHSTISIDLDDTEVISSDYSSNCIFIEINGFLYSTKSYNQESKTAQIFPCLSTEGQSGEATIFHGGGLFIKGSDSGEIRVRQLNVMTCGTGMYSKALYGGTIQGLVSQSCAIAYAIGDVPTSVGGYGETLNQPYFENNNYDLVSVSTSGCATINNPIALSHSKIWCLKPITGGSSPNVNSAEGRFYITGYIGPTADTLLSRPIVSTSVSVGVGQRGKFDVCAFDSATRARGFVLQSPTNMGKVVYGEYGVHSIIHNCKVGDTITVTAPSGHTVNGESSVTFSGLPPQFAITAGLWTSTEWRCYITPVGQLEAQVDSTATDVAGLVSDFNSLLAKLRANGGMKI